MKGQIIKIVSNLYFVNCEDSVYPCRSRGAFRNQKITPVVGDYCMIDEKEHYILEILPRKNFLIRPFVANIDQGLIVTSLKIPDFSSYLLDKLLLVMEFNQIQPIICITKEDLITTLQKEEIKSILAYYQKIGYAVYYNYDVEPLKKIFKDKITVFTGQTGAGKSSLFNRLDPSLKLDVGEVSVALGRGKHTTRWVELIELFEGKLVDTPGFSKIDITGIPKEKIRDLFVEFSNYSCKYKDCMHVHESTLECGVKDAVEKGEILKSRYDNYLRFLTEEHI